MKKLIVMLIGVGLLAGSALIPGVASAQTMVPAITTVDLGDGSSVTVFQDGTVSRQWGTTVTLGPGNQIAGLGASGGSANVMFSDGSIVHCRWNSIAPSPHYTCT